MVKQEESKPPKPPRRPDVQVVFKPLTLSNNSQDEKKSDD